MWAATDYESVSITGQTGINMQKCKCRNVAISMRYHARLKGHVDLCVLSGISFNQGSWHWWRPRALSSPNSLRLCAEGCILERDWCSELYPIAAAVVLAWGAWNRQLGSSRVPLVKGICHNYSFMIEYLIPNSHSFSVSVNGTNPVSEHLDVILMINSWYMLVKCLWLYFHNGTI